MVEKKDMVGMESTPLVKPQTGPIGQQARGKHIWLDAKIKGHCETSSKSIERSLKVGLQLSEGMGDLGSC